MSVDRSSYRADARRGTTPLHIWKDNVVALARVRPETARSANDLLVRWYNAGEPAWMAAQSLQLLNAPAPIADRPRVPLVLLGVDRVAAPPRPPAAERRAALERSRRELADAVARRPQRKRR
jgi:hypothetical protein